jgi:copper(I)-binding protein
MKQFISAITLWSITLLSQAAPVSILSPYARATPPGASNSAAFMVIINDSDNDRAIVAAKSNVAQTTELHTMTMDGQTMQMRQVDAIAIPAKGQTHLKPGGLHIMLLGLLHPLAMGNDVKLELTFDDGSTQTILAPVKSVEMTLKNNH